MKIRRGNLKLQGQENQKPESTEKRTEHSKSSWMSVEVIIMRSKPTKIDSQTISDFNWMKLKK